MSDPGMIDNDNLLAICELPCYNREDRHEL